MRVCLREKDSWNMSERDSLRERENKRESIHFMRENLRNNTLLRLVDNIFREKGLSLLQAR